MTDIFLFPAIFAFCLVLLPGPQRTYAAAAGWILLVLGFLAAVPEYLSLDNILYPALGALSIPFLVMTLVNLFKGDPRILQLSRAAAVAIIIYAPFAFIPPLRDALIATVVGQTVWLLDALGYHADLTAWNIIFRNGYATEIILACTGITAMSIMLGIAAGSARITAKQGVLAFLLVVPTIYFLNILRIAFVLIAWSEQWFAYLPDPTGTTEVGTGYASFFWAHNVIMELLALGVLIGIAFGLFRIIPDMAVFARDLADLYLDNIRAFLEERGFWKKRSMA